MSLALILLLFIAGCASSEEASDGTAPGHDQATPAPLILISFDGFRWDYPRLYDAPNLARMADDGTKAKYLKLAFPTKTFPNHYTIVTGLYPAHHGIISNSFYDPEYDDSFSLGDAEDSREERWWKGEPLWVTAEDQGLTAATYFWPGSEVPHHGTRPTYWRPYDGSVPGTRRVDEALGWLDLPDEKRPDMITLYFSDVDHAGHAHGPRSEAVANAVTEVDARLGQLMDGLEERGLADRVNVLVASDHGMAARSPERVIFLDDYVDMDDLRVSDFSPILMAWPKEGKTQDVLDALQGANSKLDVYRKENLPERYHFSGSRRIPPIIGIAAEGWSITTRGYYQKNRDRLKGGTHGYPPEVPSMRGILYAHGPAFAAGKQTAPVEAVDLYQMMCTLLDLEPASNDGDDEALRRLVRPAYRKKLHSGQPVVK